MVLCEGWQCYDYVGGAGLYCYLKNMLVKNCFFKNNRADGVGVQYTIFFLVDIRYLVACHN